MRLLLRELRNQPRLTVGVISGRALDDLKQRVALDNIVYAGNHGLEIEGPSLRFVHPVATEVAEVLSPLYHGLRRSLDGIAGTIVEDKGLTLSVHYRLTPPEQVPSVLNKVEQVVAAFQKAGRVRTTHGRKVVELRPSVDWNKGKAVETVLDHYGHKHREPGPLVVFTGDDVTDEDGFKVVEKVEGIGILVAEEPRASSARYLLHSPRQVQEFLERFLAMEEARPPASGSTKKKNR